MKNYELTELRFLGFIQITSIGEENLYFDYLDSLGHVCRGFVKCFN